MPYVARRFAPTSGPSPELTTQSRRSAAPYRPPSPYHGSSPGEEPFQKPQEDRLRMVPRLNIRDHEVSPLRVYKQLFGKEADRDERTGALVPKD